MCVLMCTCLCVCVYVFGCFCLLVFHLDSRFGEVWIGCFSYTVFGLLVSSTRLDWESEGALFFFHLATFQGQPLPKPLRAMQAQPTDFIKLLVPFSVSCQGSPTPPPTPDLEWGWGSWKEQRLILEDTKPSLKQKAHVLTGPIGGHCAAFSLLAEINPTIPAFGISHEVSGTDAPASHTMRLPNPPKDVVLVPGLVSSSTCLPFYALFYIIPLLHPL